MYIQLFTWMKINACECVCCARLRDNIVCVCLCCSRLRVKLRACVYFVEGVVEVMRRGRLRWFGHVERKEVDDWVSACRNLEVAGSRGWGRPRLTWRARLHGDMKDMGQRPGMAMDREKWRCGIMGRTSDQHKRGNIGLKSSSST